MAAMGDEAASRARVAFLIGAGASQAVHALGTEAITERVLAGPIPAKWGDEQAVALFLRVLDCQIRLFYQNTEQVGRTPNYEDLYYVAGQLRDGLMASYDVSALDNAAVEPLIEKLVDHPDVKTALREIGVARDRMVIAALARLAMSRTEGVLTDALREIEPSLEEPSTVSRAFQMFVDATLGDEQAVDLYTLNHDLILEAVLLSALSFAISSGGQPLVDGFSLGEEGFRWWNPGAFDDPAARVRLFKLHGSLNWWLSSTSLGPPWPPLLRPEFAVRADRPELPRSLGQALDPVLLIGRFNKALQQTHGVFLELLSRFQRGLRRTNTLVIVGYGFGDTPINLLLYEWLALEGHKAVVLDMDSEDLLRRVRPPVGKALDYLRSLGRVEFIDGGLQPDSWHLIAEKLNV